MSGKRNGKPGPIGFAPDVSFLSQTYRVPMINLDQYEVAPEVRALVPRELCEEHVVLPVSRVASSLIVAIADPTNETARSALREHTGLAIEVVIASEADIRRFIAKYYVP